MIDTAEILLMRIVSRSLARCIRTVLLLGERVVIPRVEWTRLAGWGCGSKHARCQWTAGGCTLQS